MIITKLMTNWKSFLKKDIINWLLEKENPSVRYYTLTKLLEKIQRLKKQKNRL